MKKSEYYTSELVKSMTPELKKRIERQAALENKSFSDVAIYFLSQGANTPLFLGAGANT